MPEQATRYIKASLSLQIHKPVLPARNRTCSFFFVVSWLVAFKKETHSGTRTLSFLIKAQDTTVFKSKGAPNMQTRVFTCDRQTEDSLPTPESVAESPPRPPPRSLSLCTWESNNQTHTMGPPWMTKTMANNARKTPLMHPLSLPDFTWKRLLYIYIYIYVAQGYS